MTKPESFGPAVGGPPAMVLHDLKDDALLLRIAVMRDQASFLELHRRYQKPAYALALYLTHDSDMAEDALQEAMLKIWLKAASCRSQNPRSWILRVVMWESFKRVRTIKRMRRRLQIRGSLPGLEGEPPSALSEPNESLEGEELLGALRKGLEELPLSDQRIVALYFAVGLSQEEVARELTLPQRTVSNRIQVILRRLRAVLPKMAAVLPEKSGVILGEALLSGVEVPQGQRERLLDRIAQGAERVPRAIAAKGFTWVLYAAGGAALLAAGGVFWMAAQPYLFEATAGPGSKPFRAEAGPRSVVLARWDLRKGPPADLPIHGGYWRWLGDGPGPSGMEVMTSGSILKLPLTLPSRPLLLTARLRLAVDRSYLNALWSEGGRLLPARTGFFPQAPRRNLDGKAIEAQFFFLGRHVVAQFAGELMAVYEYEKDYPGNQIVLKSTRAVFEDLELRTLDAADLPVRFRDPAALFLGADTFGMCYDREIPPPLPSQVLPQNVLLDFAQARSIQNLRIDFGNFRHLPDGGLNGTGCMEAELKNEKGLGGGCKSTICIPFWRLPILISMRCSFQQASPLTQMVFWSTGSTGLPPFLFGMGREVKREPGEWFEARYYVTREWVSCWEGDQHMRLAIGGEPEHFELGWWMTGEAGARMRIDDLKIREIRAGELPDLTPFLDAWKRLSPRIPLVMQQEDWEVPELKSATPDRPVQVRVFPALISPAGGGQVGDVSASPNDF